MGTLRVKSISEYDPDIIPDLFYLNRTTNCIVKLTKGVKASSNLPTCSLYKDSAAFYLSETEILLLGGSKPSGKFTKKVFKINSFNNSIERLQNLPIGTNFGTLVLYQRSVILCGAVIQRNEKEIPCPLIIKHLDFGGWDWVDVNDLLVKPKHSMLSFMRQRACLVGKKIFLVAGIKVGIGKPTKKVFSVDLGKEVPKYEMEKLKCSLKFDRICVGTVDGALFLCGQGYGVERNLTHFMKAELGSGKWEKLEEVNAGIDEEYPAFTTQQKIIFFSYPFCMVHNQSKLTILDLTCRPAIQKRKTSIEEFKNKRNLTAPASKAVSISPKGQLDFPKPLPNPPNPLPSLPSAVSPSKSKKKKKNNTKLSTHYSKSTAPMLPSNIIKPASFGSSSSQSSSNSSLSESSDTLT